MATSQGVFEGSVAVNYLTTYIPILLMLRLLQLLSTHTHSHAEYTLLSFAASLRQQAPKLLHYTHTQTQKLLLPLALQ
jgi:hypothetical protein